MKPSVGILALQGGVSAHQKSLLRLGQEPILVRSSRDLERCSSLILPGGESTTMTHLLTSTALLEPLSRFVEKRPTFATCAGLILLSKLKAIDVEVERNAYGGQGASFCTSLRVELPRGALCLEAIFIRAPKIAALSSTRPIVRAELHGSPVLVEQGHLLAATFHPELTEELALHRYFLDIALALL